MLVQEPTDIKSYHINVMAYTLANTENELLRTTVEGPWSSTPCLKARDWPYLKFLNVIPTGEIFDILRITLYSNSVQLSVRDRLAAGYNENIAGVMNSK